MDEDLRRILNEAGRPTMGRAILNSPVVLTNDEARSLFPVADDLTGYDYLNTPMTQLIKHPDFSPQAMRAVATMSTMTSDQLKKINFRGEN